MGLFDKIRGGLARTRQTLTRDQVAAIDAPVLVAVGSEDTVAGSAHELAARAVTIAKKVPGLADVLDKLAEGIAVDLQLVDAPCVGMHGLQAFVQAVLMVAVLLLEVLRAQEQALTPKNFAGHPCYILYK